MTNFPGAKYDFAGFSPSTLEDAQFLEDQRKLREAKASGDWLPEGWVWVRADEYNSLPEGVDAAWHEQSNTYVYPARAKPESPLYADLPIRIRGSQAPKGVIDMVCNRYWAQRK